MNTETTTPPSKAAESGVLLFDRSLISYTSQHYGSFSVPLSEVAAIGEFTTDNGPFVDDWFLVFVHRSGSHWFEASMYADGSDQLREQLSVALSCSFPVGLAASTDFASRIIWPSAFAGRPLFAFSPVTDSGFVRRLKLSMLPEICHSLSPDALSAIKPN